MYLDIDTINCIICSFLLIIGIFFGYIIGNLHELNKSIDDIMKLQKYDEILEENEYLKNCIKIKNNK